MYCLVWTDRNTRTQVSSTLHAYFFNEHNANDVLQSWESAGHIYKKLDGFEVKMNIQQLYPKTFKGRPTNVR